MEPVQGGPLGLGDVIATISNGVSFDFDSFSTNWLSSASPAHHHRGGVGGFEVRVSFASSPRRPRRPSGPNVP